MIGLVLADIVTQVVVAVLLSFGWHTDTYRMVSHGHGAFELCLPSLGFFITKLTLRCLFWAIVSHMIKWVATVGVGSRA